MTEGLGGEKYYRSRPDRSMPKTELQHMDLWEERFKENWSTNLIILSDSNLWGGGH